MPPTLTAAVASREGWLRGFGIFFCALVLLATLDALAKHLVQRYPAPFINIVRYLVVLSMSCALLLHNRIPFTFRVPHRKIMLWRGAMLGTVGTCFMTALHLMPLAEATAIYFLSPLIIVALSPWLLSEQVQMRQWLAVGAGFCGMLLIVRPGGNLPLVGTLLMVCAALSYALMHVLTRKLAGKVDMSVQFFFSAVICTVITAIPAPFFLPERMPPAGDMALIVMVGLLSGLGQYLVIRAFQKVPASVLAPFNYLHLLLAVGFSVVVFGQYPDMPALIGMLVIACAGLSLTLPPRKLAGAHRK
jgi:drug/metabolite transporter (DMT)-like permease